MPSSDDQLRLLRAYWIPLVGWRVWDAIQELLQAAPAIGAAALLALEREHPRHPAPETITRPRAA
jgi:hypothetical protein